MFRALKKYPSCPAASKEKYKVQVTGKRLRMLRLVPKAVLLLALIASAAALGPAKTCSTGVAEEDPTAVWVPPRCRAASCVVPENRVRYWSACCAHRRGGGARHAMQPCSDGRIE